MAKKNSRSNPADWYFQCRDARWPDLTYGVLRRRYKGRDNNAVDYARAKLQPVPLPDDADPWASTAERFDVLLPDEADDRYLDPAELMRQVDDSLPHGGVDLLTCLDIAFPETQRLHTAFELARVYAYRLAISLKTPSLIVLHNPGSGGSNNPPHVHVALVPRRLTGLGLGGYFSSLTRDQGFEELANIWVKVSNEWR